MQYDRRGLAVTGESAEAVRHLDDAVRSLFAHRLDTGEHLARALAADPELVAGLCLAGFAQLMLGRGELVATARRHADAARRAIAARGATPREKALCRALEAWLAGGDMDTCAAILDRALALNPLDALTFKLSHAVRFMLGDAVGMRLAVEMVRPAWSSDVPEFGYVLGCQAFALEETGALGEAEQIGRDALEIEPLDAWGCHAVAHVFETGGRPGDGIAWLDAHRSRFGGVNNFAGHLAWHSALFHLSLGDIEQVLALYDTVIRADKTDDYRDIANAASLLWRLERQRIAVGDRWAELADIAERRIGDRTLVFAQLHYMMCLIGERRWDKVEAMRQAMVETARTSGGTQARLLAQCGITTSDLMAALRRGRPFRDATQLYRLAARLHGIGGSHAQRSVFVGMVEDATAQGRLPAVIHQLDKARSRRRVAERLALPPLAASRA